MTQKNIWWIRRDIRLQDNQALAAALKDADQLIPLFIIEPGLMGKSAPKRQAFLLNALQDLDQQLRALDSRLVIRQGPAQEAFSALQSGLGQFSIYAHEDYSPFSRLRDQAIQEIFNLKTFPGVALREPGSILKDDGEPYTVYTPFKNKWNQDSLPTPADCLPSPAALPPVPENLSSANIPAAEPAADFPGTSNEAQNRLNAFIKDGIQEYQSKRNRMDLNATSRLSPYLRFGLISPREALSQAQIALLQARDKARAEIRTWMDELVWREFYIAILFHFPQVMTSPFRSEYQNVPWRNAPEDLESWKSGETGFPIVDACMQQLKETGWMHNRGRMIVASFLTKDLLINWQEGEAWFMANLVDGDPAANNGGWQWTAGTGTDAAPYFRIFNPILQGLKFDPDGEYIVKWVPALQKLPPKFRHEPWLMNKEESRKFNFGLGKDYPEQIVDRQFARQRTLDAYKIARQG